MSVTEVPCYFLPFFRYQTLATATDDAKQDNDAMSMSGKRIVADWVLGLGEYIWRRNLMSFTDIPC